MKINLTFPRTYATEANAEKAVAAKGFADKFELRYIIVRTPDNRFAPLFMFNDAASQAGVHFHFNVIN
jgi:hypothetical protein